MPRTLRSSIPAPVLGLLVVVLAFGLTGCSGDDDPGASSGSSAVPDTKPSSPEKSCQGIDESGSVEDIQAVFDKYKNNSQPFSAADEQKMRNALDRLAKAGDNAAPRIREDAVQLVADVGALIDSRAGLPGVGKVASSEKIQKRIDALCS